jgi:hypothetical protein
MAMLLAMVARRLTVIRDVTTLPKLQAEGVTPFSAAAGSG